MALHKIPIGGLLQPRRKSTDTAYPVQTQVNEMQLVREKVYAMEQNHMTLKQKYVPFSDSQTAVCAPIDNPRVCTGMRKKSPISVASSIRPAEAFPRTPWSALLTQALLRLPLQLSGWVQTLSAPS